MAAKIVPAPDYDERVRTSFARQGAMRTLGAELTLVAPGTVEIEMPYSDQLTQQHGFLHAGVISAALDSACAAATTRSTRAPGVASTISSSSVSAGMRSSATVRRMNDSRSS